MNQTNPNQARKPLTKTAARFRSIVRLALKKGLVPSFLYLVGFVLLTYPLITLFSTHYFTDEGDGLQNLWNLWWVRKSLLELHQLPWHTSFIHYPHGTSLLAHTLNPFNGILAILFSSLMNEVQTHNSIVIFAFVMTGVTTFWLANYFVESFWASIIAGYIFTFSNYHFAHVDGHLNLISLEWIPLFLLTWFALLARPRVWLAIACALTLFVVLLCDYYYFLYCVFAAAMILLCECVRRRSIRFLLRRDYLVSMGVLVGLGILTSGPLIFSFLKLATSDSFIEYWDPRNDSLDLLSLFLPGGHWRFHHLTEWHWSRLPVNIEESTYLGFGLVFLLIVAFAKRKQLHPALGCWLFVLVACVLLAMGPSLQIAAHQVPYSGIAMPYRLVEFGLPILKTGGRPVRFMSLALLASAIAIAMLLSNVFKSRWRREWLSVCVVLALTVFEHLPKTLPARLNPIPDFVRFLKATPDREPALDVRDTRFHSLYYQTLYEHPIAFGYISRTPRSVHEKDRLIEQLFAAAKYTELRRLGFRYLILPAAENSFPYEVRLYKGHLPAELPASLVYKDTDVRIFDLAQEPGAEERK